MASGARKQEVFDLEGLRFSVSHRSMRGDGGPSIEVYGNVEGAPVQVFRFDCFEKEPHYHVAPNGADARTDLDPSEADSLEWSLGQIRENLPQMLRAAGFTTLSRSIDARALAAGWTRVRDAVAATSSGKRGAS